MALEQTTNNNNNIFPFGHPQSVSAPSATPATPLSPKHPSDFRDDIEIFLRNMNGQTPWTSFPRPPSATAPPTPAGRLSPGPTLLSSNHTQAPDQEGKNYFHLMPTPMEQEEEFGNFYTERTKRQAQIESDKGSIAPLDIYDPALSDADYQGSSKRRRGDPSVSQHDSIQQSVSQGLRPRFEEVDARRFTVPQGGLVSAPQSPPNPVSPSPTPIMPPPPARASRRTKYTRAKVAPDDPIERRTYYLPSTTSRKVLPVAVAKRLNASLLENQVLPQMLDSRLQELKEVSFDSTNSLSSTTLDFGETLDDNEQDGDIPVSSDLSPLASALTSGFTTPALQDEQPPLLSLLSLTPEVVSAVPSGYVKTVLKRRAANTLSARRSRERKRREMEELSKKVLEQDSEMEELRARLREKEEEIRMLRDELSWRYGSEQMEELAMAEMDELRPDIEVYQDEEEPMQPWWMNETN